MAIERSDDRSLSELTRLLHTMSEAGVLSTTQMDEGFRRVYENMADIQLDVPNAHTLLERIVTAANVPGSTRGGAETREGAPLPAPPQAEPELGRVPEPPPPDRPDARDDDVVARQLREAAMAETDPELREQLWEEYRRYKSGL